MLIYKIIVLFINNNKRIEEMDYRDHEAGVTKEHYCVRGRCDLLNTILSKIATGKKRLKILNLGVGTGNDLEILNRYGDNYVVDIDTNALKMIKKFYTEKKLADACNLPYKSNFFDVVVSFDVFEHIEHHQKAMDEAYRVLKKGGNLVFSVPAFQSLFSARDKAMGHYRRYRKKQLRTCMEKFSRVKLNYWNCSVFPIIAPLRIIQKNNPPQMGDPKISRTAHNFLYALIRIEDWAIKHSIPLPFGITLVGVCTK